MKEWWHDFKDWLKNDHRAMPMIMILLFVGFVLYALIHYFITDGGSPIRGGGTIGRPH